MIVVAAIFIVMLIINFLFFNEDFDAIPVMFTLTSIVRMTIKIVIITSVVLD